MDFDTWDDSIASPQHFSKLLGETDRQPGALKMSSPWKVQNNNQSRFSFARQEDSKNQAFDVQSSLNVVGQFSNNRNRDLGLENLGIGNVFSSSSFEDPEIMASII